MHKRLSCFILMMCCRFYVCVCRSFSSESLQNYETFYQKTGQHLVQILTQIIYGVAVWNENVITLISASYKKTNMEEYHNDVK